MGHANPKDIEALLASITQRASILQSPTVTLPEEEQRKEGVGEEAEGVDPSSALYIPAVLVFLHERLHPSHYLLHRALNKAMDLAIGLQRWPEVWVVPTGVHHARTSHTFPRAGRRSRLGRPRSPH